MCAGAVEYTRLGFDGIGYIVVVQTTPEEAERVAASLPSVSSSDWADFMEKK